MYSQTGVQLLLAGSKTPLYISPGRGWKLCEPLYYPFSGSYLVMCLYSGSEGNRLLFSPLPSGLRNLLARILRIACIFLVEFLRFLLLRSVRVASAIVISPLGRKCCENRQRRDELRICQKKKKPFCAGTDGLAPFEVRQIKLSVPRHRP